MAEIVKDFDTYEQASMNACSALGHIKPAKIVPQQGRLGDGRQQIVGIELLNAAGKKIARIRLDIDESKGIHWNTEDWQTSTTKKTASCIRSIKGRPTASNAVLYNQYVRALYGISGDTIWQRWTMGVAAWIRVSVPNASHQTVFVR